MRPGRCRPVRSGAFGFHFPHVCMRGVGPGCAWLGGVMSSWGCWVCGGLSDLEGGGGLCSGVGGIGVRLVFAGQIKERFKDERSCLI